MTKRHILFFFLLISGIFNCHCFIFWIIQSLVDFNLNPPSQSYPSVPLNHRQHQQVWSYLHTSFFNSSIIQLVISKIVEHLIFSPLLSSWNWLKIWWIKKIVVKNIKDIFSNISSARDIRFQICELYLYVNTDLVSDEKWEVEKTRIFTQQQN